MNEWHAGETGRVVPPGFAAGFDQRSSLVFVFMPRSATSGIVDSFVTHRSARSDKKPHAG
jgi:hypothetical protein